MKKIIFLALAISTLFGCSSDSSSSNNIGSPSNQTIQINPPSWIQGTWLQKTASLTSGFRFTSNDVVIIQAGTEQSLRGQIALVSASEESTQNTYKVTSNFPSGQSVIYSFTKISDTEIRWDAVSVAIFTKQ